MKAYLSLGSNVGDRRAHLAEGVAIVIVSSDLPEILTICERVVVMHEGRVTGTLNASELSESKVMSYATGIHAGEGNGGY